MQCKDFGQENQKVLTLNLFDFYNLINLINFLILFIILF